MSEHYVVLDNNRYVLYNKENLRYLGREALAAKVTLSESDFERLESMSDEEFEDWLRHYFDAGQLVILDSKGE